MSIRTSNNDAISIYKYLVEVNDPQQFNGQSIEQVTELVSAYLGHEVSTSTVQSICREHGIDWIPPRPVNATVSLSAMRRELEESLAAQFKALESTMHKENDAIIVDADKELTRLDERLDSLDSRFVDFIGTLSALDKRVRDMDDRLGDIEVELNRLRSTQSKSLEVAK